MPPLGFGEQLPDFGLVNQQQIDLLEEALQGLDDAPTLRTRVLGHLAQALYWVDPATRPGVAGQRVRPRRQVRSAARLPTPVMVAEPVTGHGEKGDHLVDAAVEGGDRGLQVLEVAEGEPDQQPMVVVEAAPQRLTQLRELGAQPALGQPGGARLGRVRRPPGP